MKMNADLEAAFNSHITAEFASTYNYLQMSAWFDSQHLLGFAQWMRTQADEEWVHGMRFYDHVLERGNDIKLQSVPAPQHEFTSCLQVFESALENEREVSKKIHELFELATANNDYPSYSLLQEFIDEQVEEESTMEHIVARLKLTGNNPPALLMLDQELAQRTKVKSGN